MMEYAYVVLGENPEDGVHVLDVYANEDDALARMRAEFEEYGRDEPDLREDVRWHNAGDGLAGRWGWYDTNVPYGCYVHRFKVRKGAE